MTNTPDLILHVNDDYATMIWNLTDTLGAAVDITGYTSVTVISIFGDSHKKTKAATINNVNPAQIQWQFDAGMLKEGLNEIRATVAWPTGRNSYTTTDFTIRGLR